MREYALTHSTRLIGAYTEYNIEHNSHHIDRLLTRSTLSHNVPLVHGMLNKQICNSNSCPERLRRRVPSTTINQPSHTHRTRIDASSRNHQPIIENKHRQASTAHRTSAAQASTKRRPVIEQTLNKHRASAEQA